MKDGQLDRGPPGSPDFNDGFGQAHTDDRFTVNFQDDIAGPDARLVRRGAGDRGDNHDLLVPGRDVGADALELAFEISQAQPVMLRLQVGGVGVIQRVDDAPDGGAAKIIGVEPGLVHVVGKDDIPGLPDDIQGPARSGVSRRSEHEAATESEGDDRHEQQADDEPGRF